MAFAVCNTTFCVSPSQTCTFTVNAHWTHIHTHTQTHLCWISSSCSLGSNGVNLPKRIFCFIIFSSLQICCNLCLPPPFFCISICKSGSLSPYLTSSLSDPVAWEFMNLYFQWLQDFEMKRESFINMCDVVLPLTSPSPTKSWSKNVVCFSNFREVMWVDKLCRYISYTIYQRLTGDHFWQNSEEYPTLLYVCEAKVTIAILNNVCGTYRLYNLSALQGSLVQLQFKQHANMLHVAHISDHDNTYLSVPSGCEWCFSYVSTFSTFTGQTN